MQSEKGGKQGNMFLECLYDNISFVVLCVCEPIGMERFESIKKKER